MQRLLLDTHAFLWWVSEVSRLTAGARAAIADPRNDVFVSAVSGWEIAVKKAKGKFKAIPCFGRVLKADRCEHRQEGRRVGH